VRSVDVDGTVVGFVSIEGHGFITNRCFGGDDLRTLFATDALPGRVVALNRMPKAALALLTLPDLDLRSSNVRSSCLRSYLQSDPRGHPLHWREMM